MGALELHAKILLLKKLAKTTEVDNRKRRNEKKRNQLKGMYLHPSGLKRVVVDGKEYLVKDILAIEKDRIVVELPDGTIKIVKRKHREHQRGAVEEHAEL